MKTTPNLIDGELMIVEGQLKQYGSTTDIYSKQSYQHGFFKAIARTTKRNHITKSVRTIETEEDYILKVEG